MWYIIERKEGRADYIGKLWGGRGFATMKEALAHKPRQARQGTFILVHLLEAPKSVHVYTRNVNDYETNYMVFKSRAQVEIVPIEY
jgi:hypothetical protein